MGLSPSFTRCRFVLKSLAEKDLRGFGTFSRPYIVGAANSRSRWRVVSRLELRSLNLFMVCVLTTLTTQRPRLAPTML